MLVGGFCYLETQPGQPFPLVSNPYAKISLPAAASYVMYRHESGIDLFISLSSKKIITQHVKLSLKFFLQLICCSLMPHHSILSVTKKRTKPELSK